MKKIYNKLVRDKIPDIILKDQKICKTKILLEQDYKELLKRKLLEEANEVCQAVSKEEICKEIADVWEVVDAIMDTFHLSKEEVLKEKEQKAFRNGKFEKRILLESVEDTYE